MSQNFVHWFFMPNVYHACKFKFTHHHLVVLHCGNSSYLLSSNVKPMCMLKWMHVLWEFDLKPMLFEQLKCFNYTCMLQTSRLMIINIISIMLLNFSNLDLFSFFLFSHCNDELIKIMQGIWVKAHYNPQKL